MYQDQSVVPVLKSAHAVLNMNVARESRTSICETVRAASHYRGNVIKTFELTWQRAVTLCAE